MTLLSSPKEGLRNSVRYYCSVNRDKRRTRMILFYTCILVLMVALTLYWLDVVRTRTILQHIQVIQEESVMKLLPKKKELEVHDLKDRRGEMAHGHHQQGLVIVNKQAYYDTEAMKAFIIGILGSHQPLSEHELDGVMHWLTKDVPELTPHRRVGELPTPCWNGGNQNMFCLPKAYVLGSKRSAWVDLYYRLTSHPEILQSWRVEEKFMSRDSSMNLREIARNYGINVEVNNAVTQEGTLLEGNPDDFFHAMDPTLADIDMPRSLLVAQIIRRLTPDAKFIVILRNPVEAALSYYVFRRRPVMDSQEDFHKFIEGIIHEVYNVTFNEGLDACYGKGHLHENLLYWTYIVYLQDYLTVFPEENIYFVRTEDYADKAKREDILQEIFDFLQVRPLDWDSLKYLSGMDPLDDESKRWHNPKLMNMFDNTSALISSFFEPFNQVLAETLKDDKFLWSHEKPVEIVHEEDPIVKDALKKLPTN